MTAGGGFVTGIVVAGGGVGVFMWHWMRTALAFDAERVRVLEEENRRLRRDLYRMADSNIVSIDRSAKRRHPTGGGEP